MAKYERIYSIKDDSTSLVCQERTDLNPHFHCVCWRETRFPTPGKRITNRRFYFEKGSFWTIPFDRALNMMQQAKRDSFFDESETDPGKISSYDIADPKNKNYDQLIGKALVNCNYDQEWKTSIAVICNQSCGMWRKVMMVNLNIMVVTFRSLTADNGYKFTYAEKSADGWRLDRSMLDAHPTAFLHWLELLESIAK